MFLAAESSPQSHTPSMFPNKVHKTKIYLHRAGCSLVLKCLPSLHKAPVYTHKSSIRSLYVYTHTYIHMRDLNYSLSPPSHPFFPPSATLQPSAFRSQLHGSAGGREGKGGNQMLFATGFAPPHKSCPSQLCRTTLVPVRPSSPTAHQL